MKITSAKTARNQLPAIHKLLKNLKEGDRVFDIGCGKPKKFQRWCEDNGIKYIGYDPHHQSVLIQECTLDIIAKFHPQVATISNVLNVIKEKDDRIAVLKQAKKSLKDGGMCFITVYSGGSSNVAGETRDGWQNRKPIEWYLPECEEVFGFGMVSVSRREGVKHILAIVE